MSFFLSIIIILIHKRNKCNINSANNFIFFLYGGIGDHLLLVNLINTLSKKCNVSVFLDNRFKDIEIFLPGSKILNYTKHNLIKLFKDFRHIDKESIFISHSSSLELQLLYIISKSKFFFGFNGSYDNFFFNSNYKNEIKNKYKIYNELFFDYLKLKNDFNILNIIKPDKGIIGYFNIPKKKYLIININKTHYWGDVSMPIIEWSNYINNSEILINYSLILVGNGEKETKKNNQLYRLIDSQKFDVIDLTNKTSLIDLSSLIYFASFIITNDTGIMHLSNLFKKRNISLFTFSDPKIFANYENSLVIHNPKYNCQPCVNKSLRGNENYPPICKNNFVCNKTITSIDIEKITNYYLNNLNN